MGAEIEPGKGGVRYTELKSMPPLLHNHLIDRLALVNGLVSGIALYPQVWAILASGSTVGDSLPTFLLIFFNSIVWLAYALHRGLISLGIASVLNTLASGILVCAIIFF